MISSPKEQRSPKKQRSFKYQRSLKERWTFVQVVSGVLPGISHAFAVIDNGTQVTFTGFGQLVDGFEDVIYQNTVCQDGFPVGR